nr:hypothetical protein [Bradyrhizobium sp. CSA112]
MAKSLTEIRSAARSHTEAALNCLVGIMGQTDAPPSARVAAANSILDRGWGKPAQPIENGEDGPLELLHRIERVIVRPENTNG